jgi:hypothetical protein
MLLTLDASHHVEPVIQTASNERNGVVSSGSRNYDVSGDGKRFLMVKPPAKQAAAPQIIVGHNWFEELSRLVPAK